jgi:hypothetical protein
VTYPALRCNGPIASLGRPIQFDVEVLGRAIDAANVQNFAQSDHLERLIGQNIARTPTLAGHPDLIVPRCAAVAFQERVYFLNLSLIFTGFHRNRDYGRNDWGSKRSVGPIGKYELHGVPTARQREFGFSLPAAEMKMATVADDRLFQLVR